MTAPRLLVATNSNSKVFTVFTNYQFRKMVFTAGYTNLNQFVSTAGMPAANYLNFDVGIQRWFKALENDAQWETGADSDPASWGGCGVLGTPAQAKKPKREKK